jgi:hypothetical protein
VAGDPTQRLIDEHGYWGEIANYPRADWKYEVANDDTVLGYWDWVAAKQADDDEPAPGASAGGVDG